MKLLNSCCYSCYCYFLDEVLFGYIQAAVHGENIKFLSCAYVKVESVAFAVSIYCTLPFAFVLHIV